MNSSGILNQLRLSSAKFWAARDMRERAMLKVAAATVLLGLAYAALIAPPLAGIDRLNKSLPALRQQAEQLRALSKEAAALSARPAQPSVAVSRENIETSLALKGIKPQSVTVAGDTVKLQLASVSFADMLDWLQEIQGSAMLAVTEANVAAQDKPDTVNATLTLQRSRNE